MTITIYSTPSCVYCKKAKEFLDKNNIAFEEVNVAKDQDSLNSFVELTGQRSVPVIKVDGEMMLGYNEVKLKQMLGIAPDDFVIEDPAEAEVCDSCQ